jgi:type IV secretion system protein VirB5
MKLSLVAALVLSTAPMIANAGIPVIDGASVAQSVLQVANGIQTIQSLQQSYAQMQQTYNATIGSRNIGALFDNPALTPYLPTGMQQMYNTIRTGDTSSIAGQIAGYAAQYQNGNNQAQNQSNQQANAQQNAAKNRAIIDQVFQSSNARLNELTGLMNTIDLAQDPKAAQDLGNRINAEVGILQAEQSKIQLVKMAADADDKLLRQQANDSVNTYNQNSGKNPHLHPYGN